LSPPMSLMLLQNQVPPPTVGPKSVVLSPFDAAQQQHAPSSAGDGASPTGSSSGKGKGPRKKTSSSQPAAQLLNGTGSLVLMAREPHPGSLPITRPLQIQPPLLFDAAQQQHASSGPLKPSSSQPAAQLLNGTGSLVLMAREPHPGSLPITRPLQIQPPLLFDAAQQQHASSGPLKPSSSQPAAQLLNGIVPPPVVTEIPPHCGKSSALGAGAGAGYSAEAEAKEEPVARVSTRGEAPAAGAGEAAAPVR